MKFIVKGESPNEFEAWKEYRKPTRWNHLHSNLPEYPEKDVVNYSRAQLRAVLHNEQNGLCCYCNAKIEDDHTSPIEHLEPREGDTQSERIFDYNNLLLSCNGGQKVNTNPKVLHCDANKKTKSIALTPLMPECETEIYFTEDGEINANTDRATKTVNALNLHHISLDNKRRAAIIPYLYSDFENDNPKEILPTDEIRQSFTLLQQNHGIAYWSAIVSVLRRYL
ncbi:MAG: TIGR02646 family protein [Saprospiraceae bacterium]|jgi:uncharacterized protein (TIGR02646 family)|nr:TIGR02646 family protein [Saprospiraceae bacterium]